MSSIGTSILLSIVAGLAAGSQSIFTSSMSRVIGTWGSVFIVHLGGTLLALLFLVLSGNTAMANLHSVPWYALSAGFLGVILLGCVSYTIPNIGAGGTLTLLIFSQLLLAAIVDHFGLFSVTPQPLSFARAAGFVVMLFGTWMALRH
jgi:bacterial/archaeal transporter family-2 protein